MPNDSKQASFWTLAFESETRMKECKAPLLVDNLAAGKLAAQATTRPLELYSRTWTQFIQSVCRINESKIVLAARMCFKRRSHSQEWALDVLTSIIRVLWSITLKIRMLWSKFSRPACWKCTKITLVRLPALLDKSSALGWGRGSRRTRRCPEAWFAHFLPPPVPRRPWFRPQLSESEKPLGSSVEGAPTLGHAAETRDLLLLYRELVVVRDLFVEFDVALGIDDNLLVVFDRDDPGIAVGLWNSASQYKRDYYTTMTYFLSYEAANTGPYATV